MWYFTSLKKVLAQQNMHTQKYGHKHCHNAWRWSLSLCNSNSLLCAAQIQFEMRRAMSSADMSQIFVYGSNRDWIDKYGVWQCNKQSLIVWWMRATVFPRTLKINCGLLRDKTMKMLSLCHICLSFLLFSSCLHLHLFTQDKQRRGGKEAYSDFLRFFICTMSNKKLEISTPCLGSVL